MIRFGKIFSVSISLFLKLFERSTKHLGKKLKNSLFFNDISFVIATAQNIFSLIGREQYNIYHIVLLVSILLSLRKTKHNKQRTISMVGINRNLLIKNKSIINQKLFLHIDNQLLINAELKPELINDELTEVDSDNLS